MTQTVRQLIDEQATWLAGRDNEMDVLRRLLGEGGPLVVFVYGIAGIGKSALVEAFGVEARASGATVLRLDCRSIEPTQQGFLAALEGKTGGELTTAEAAATLRNVPIKSSHVELRRSLPEASTCRPGG